MAVFRPAVLVLDSGAVTALARDSHKVDSHLKSLKGAGIWPPSVPTVVLVKCMHGRGDLDAQINAFLKSVEVRQQLPLAVARRAAALRTKAGRGSAVDAILVALADPEGIVITGDPDDLRALASAASNVKVVAI